MSLSVCTNGRITCFNGITVLCNFEEQRWVDAALLDLRIVTLVLRRASEL